VLFKRRQCSAAVSGQAKLPPDDNENWLKPDGAAMLRLKGDEAAGEGVRLLADQVKA